MKKLNQNIVKERIKYEFFIDTKGKCHRWEGSLKEAKDWASLHTLIANWQILAHIPKVKSGMKSGTDILHKLGWIAMGSAVYGKLIKNEPTQAQINTLDSLGFNKIKDENGVLHSW